MNTQLLTGEDTRFLAQQPEYEVDIMVGQMTTLMQNITDLQNDTDDKVAQLQNQGWFKKMTNTLFGKNKATKQEIQKNNDKVMTYISQSVAQLYQMNLINERVICSLGNRMNEVYLQVTEMNQEMLTMKGQISQLMAVQQQTMEALGAFVNKLNEKIESVDNFHMMISEIQNGMYNDSSKLYNLCSILSQLDKRQMEDNRKMALLKDSMEKAGIITEDEITVQECLKEIVALPQEKIGLIYLELCNFRNSFPANLFADMIENYHFLSKMEKMSKKKEVLIQRVLDQYELDPDAAFSIADISESFFENKLECLISPEMLRIGENQHTEGNSYVKEEESEIDYDSLSADELIALANNGDVEAMDTLGAAYEDGEDDEDSGILGIEKDLEEAVKWYRKAAEQGYAPAQDSLGDCHHFGHGVDVDYVEAVKWYRKAAEQGYRFAQFSLGMCYHFGHGVDEDDIEAVKWYRKAAEQGFDYAQFWLGKCYCFGYGVDIDYIEAVKWYRKAAEQGFDTAQWLLGDCYYCGRGVDEDKVKAVKWYRKAAEQGNAYAKTDLGWCYYCGDGVAENVEKAEELLFDAATEDSSLAMLRLGHIYINDGNATRAIDWYKKAAEHGEAYADTCIGEIYRNGNGIEQNYEKAYGYFKKAANNGEPEAQNYLGLMFLQGEHVKENDEKAVAYFQQAAEQELPVAQYNLGSCYYNGWGTSKDNGSAKFWMKKAAEQGHESAIEFLNENF